MSRLQTVTQWLWAFCRGRSTTRFETITQKIPREKTGLRGSFFAHVDFDKGRVVGIRFSTKWKEENHVMDDVLTALGDALTDIIGEKA